MNLVIGDWEASFVPVRKEVEVLTVVRSGRVLVSIPFKTGDERTGSTITPVPSREARNMVHRSPFTSNLAGKPNDTYHLHPSHHQTEKPETKHHKRPLETGPVGPGVATDFTVATGLANSSAVQAPDSRTKGGTFGYATNRTADLANLAVRKKPPPPPPPKKVILGEEFVIALYDFAGQGIGDLSFQQGDLIRVIKKTETDQDWWVGEFEGTRGNFPANYCRLRQS